MQINVENTKKELDSRAKIERADRVSKFLNKVSSVSQRTSMKNPHDAHSPGICHFYSEDTHTTNNQEVVICDGKEYVVCAQTIKGLVNCRNLLNEDVRVLRDSAKSKAAEIERAKSTIAALLDTKLSLEIMNPNLRFENTRKTVNHLYDIMGSYGLAYDFDATDIINNIIMGNISFLGDRLACGIEKAIKAGKLAINPDGVDNKVDGTVKMFEQLRVETLFSDSIKHLCTVSDFINVDSHCLLSQIAAGNTKILVDIIDSAFNHALNANKFNNTVVNADRIALVDSRNTNTILRADNAALKKLLAENREHVISAISCLRIRRLIADPNTDKEMIPFVYGETFLPNYLILGIERMRDKNMSEELTAANNKIEELEKDIQCLKSINDDLSNKNNDLRAKERMYCCVINNVIDVCGESDLTRTHINDGNTEILAKSIKNMLSHLNSRISVLEQSNSTLIDKYDHHNKVISHTMDVLNKYGADPIYITDKIKEGDHAMLGNAVMDIIESARKGGDKQTNQSSENKYKLVTQLKDISLALQVAVKTLDESE